MEEPPGFRVRQVRASFRAGERARYQVQITKCQAEGVIDGARKNWLATMYGKRSRLQSFWIMANPYVKYRLDCDQSEANVTDTG